MIRRLGYAGVALGIEATTSRTCRLENARPERLRELIHANLRGLAKILYYNAQLDIRLFRISSQIVPFASHPVNSLRWWEEFADVLQELGADAIAKDIRLSMHPGQYTVLCSPRDEVVDAARRDLFYHTHFLDVMGLGSEHKIVIHGGGTYGDKAAAINRFVDAYRRLPSNVRVRLVLENDERSYSAQDVLDINDRVGVPVIFDALHDAVLPSPNYPRRPDLLKACFDTWTALDGPPVVHFSSQDPTKQPGAHAAWIAPHEFLIFARDTADHPVDCMLEAKQKDLALLALRRDISQTGYLEMEAMPFGASVPSKEARR